MKIKVAIIGEGETEVGNLDFLSGERSGGLSPKLLSKAVECACNSNADLEIVLMRKFSDGFITSARVSVEGKRLHIKNPPIKRKMLAELLAAKAKGADLIFFQRDQEKPTLQSIGNLWNEVVAESGIDADRFPIVAIACPCRSIETWLLADVARVQKVCNNFTSPFSGSAEERPEPSELKKVIEKLADDMQLSRRELYVMLIELIDCGRLVKLCPSFADFLTTIKPHCASLGAA